MLNNNSRNTSNVTKNNSYVRNKNNTYVTTRTNTIKTQNKENRAPECFYTSIFEDKELRKLFTDCLFNKNDEYYFLSGNVEDTIEDNPLDLEAIKEKQATCGSLQHQNSRITTSLRIWEKFKMSFATLKQVLIHVLNGK